MALLADEFGLALLTEGGDAFLIVAAGEAAYVSLDLLGDDVAVGAGEAGVDGALGGLDGERGVVDEGLDELLSEGLELVDRHDMVEPAGAQGFLGVEEAAGEHQLFGDARPEQGDELANL